jgi:hypothetical protein
MEQSHIFELIAVFSPEERKEFELFIESPFFNRNTRNTEVQHLYALILHAHDNPDAPRSKEDIYKVLFPDKDWINGKIDKLMTELTKLARTFIVTQKYLQEENEFQQMIDLAAFYKHRSLDSRYQLQIEKLEKHQNSQQQESLWHYFRAFQLQFEIHETESAFNRQKSDINILNTIQALEKFSTTFSIELLNRYLTQQVVTSLDLDESLIPLIQKAEQQDYDTVNSPLLHMTYSVFRMYRNSQNADVEIRRQMVYLEKNEHLLGREEVKHFYTYLRNFCTLLVDAGQADMVLLLHELQRKNLEKGYLYFDGKLSSGAYFNLAKMAFFAGNLEWALEFIESHRNRVVGQNESNDFYGLNKACYLFEAKRYDEALDLVPASFTYMDIHLMARRLELKIYYETQSDLLPYKIDAFKMFVSRAGQKVMSPYLKEYNTNFINLLYQLSQSIPGDKKRASRLLERAQEKGKITESRWLIEKINEL